MRVAVTGSNGFVGLNVVEALLARGHEVRALVRPTSDSRLLQRVRVAIERGALSDGAWLDRALSGVHAVIHCAGNTSCDRRRLAQLVAANVEGTRAVVRAALRAGARRFVYTSTTSTIGAVDDPRHASGEDVPLAGFRARSPYARTKLEAERIVRDAMRQGLQPVILNPAEIIGAWDHTLNWGRMVLAVCHDQVPFVPPGSASFCSASEVGRAHVAALERGTPGASYILAGADASYRALIETIARVAGVRPHIPDGSYTAMRVAASLAAALSPLFKRPPVVEPYRLRVFAGHYHFDSAKAVRDLGYSPASLQASVEECWDWYRREGMVPPNAERAAG